jgi:hypothetical protein
MLTAKTELRLQQAISEQNCIDTNNPPVALFTPHAEGKS